jgi:hypothetical protein
MIALFTTVILQLNTGILLVMLIRGFIKKIRQVTAAE